MSTTGLTAPARLDKSYELNGTHLWRWPRLRPRPVGGAVPVVSRSDRAPYERGRLVVTALGAGEFTFEVVQRADRGAPQARIPAFAHVGKIQPSKIAVTGRRAVLGRYRQANRERECRTGCLPTRAKRRRARSPRGSPDRTASRRSLWACCGAGRRSARTRARGLHVEVENQAAAPGVCPWPGLHDLPQSTGARSSTIACRGFRTWQEESQMDLSCRCSCGGAMGHAWDAEEPTSLLQLVNGMTA